MGFTSKTCRVCTEPINTWGRYYCSRKCAGVRLVKYPTDALRREHLNMYGTWIAMRRRCNNPLNPQWKRYGGRGIKVCARWSSFKRFCIDMGQRPEGLTLDRINNDGDYKPSNCRWATRSQQQRNRRLTVTIETPKGRMCLMDAAEAFKIPPGRLYTRLRLGWTAEQALMPVHTYRARLATEND